MRRLIRHFIASLLTAGLLYSTAVLAQPADPAAVDAVHDYLQSLMLGDTTRLRDRMSDTDSNKQQRKLLNNPNYARRLEEAYANSTYGIVGDEQVAPDRAHVDVEITLETGHPLNVRFVLEVDPADGNYRIVEEI